MLFEGFTQSALDFLTEVHERNSKAWFEKHRSEYESLLLNPFRALVDELAPVMLSIDPSFDARPQVNKTISKIFRDARFSRDNSLFRDVMWLVFKRTAKDWTGSIPGFFFELSPYGYRYGNGFYSPAPAIMAAFREKIDDDPDSFRKVVAFLNKETPFILAGETYKRPKMSNHTPEIDDWYQKKSFYLVVNRRPDNRLFSSDLVGELLDGFIESAPVYRYLAELVFHDSL